MDYEYLTFRSVTAAMKASRALLDADITGALIRTPQALRVRGCGYSVRILSEKRLRALDVLARSGARPEKRYRRAADGVWQEVGQ